MEAKHRVVDFWMHHGFRVTISDSRAGPFNLSQARNTAARVACMSKTTDVLIMADADTIPDIAAVHRAVDKAHSEGMVVWPFTEYRHIPGEWVSRADLMAAPITQRYTRSVGGLFVVRPDVFWELGGNDERFVGWGYEDSAFHVVVTTMAKVRRENGIVFSFDHQAERNLTPTNPNRDLYQQYRAAMFNRQKIGELINEARIYSAKNSQRSNRRPS